ncbi:hypothetical protein PWT90_03678 [Aphanocladium album]|nr:hypothetical protein PWT90_03678 [Aphanocladium album]
MFVKTFIFATTAACYARAVLAAPGVPQICGQPPAGPPSGNTTSSLTGPATALPTGDIRGTPAAPLAGNPGDECTEANRVNCNNVGGTHDDTIIGKPNQSGAGCVDCGNNGGNHGNTIINGEGLVPGAINALPGDCVDCGHNGGDFGNTVVFGRDTA